MSDSAIAWNSYDANAVSVFTNCTIQTSYATNCLSISSVSIKAQPTTLKDYFKPDRIVTMNDLFPLYVIGIIALVAIADWWIRYWRNTK